MAYPEIHLYVQRSPRVLSSSSPIPPAQVGGMGLNYLPKSTLSQRIQMGRGIRIASTIEDPS